MINHAAKNGFPSNILDEEYHPYITLVYTSETGNTKSIPVNHDVVIDHGMFGSFLTLRLENEIYIIDINEIIADILEVEHENENLYTDR